MYFVIIIIIVKPLWTVASLHCGHGGYRRPSSYEETFQDGSTRSFMVDQGSVDIWCQASDQWKGSSASIGLGVQEHLGWVGRHGPCVGLGHPSSPLSIYFLIFFLFYFFLSFLGFTYFLLLTIPSLSTRIVPLRFQAGGRRRRPNLSLVSFFCIICVICIS